MTFKFGHGGHLEDSSTEALLELENLSYSVMAFTDRAIENNRNAWCRRAKYHGVFAHYNIECQVGTDSEFQSSRPHAVVGEEKLPDVFGVGKKELLFISESPAMLFKSTHGNRVSAVRCSLSRDTSHDSYDQLNSSI